MNYDAIEKDILDNKYSSYAYEYARDVIKGRWPEAEEFIKKDPLFAYVYALDVIKGRFLEAEEHIKKNPQYACWYSLRAIKGRWPEAEEYIKKNAFHWSVYIFYICQKCGGEGVIDFGIGGAVEECPTCFGKGFDPSKLPD